MHAYKESIKNHEKENVAQQGVLAWRAKVLAPSLALQLVLSFILSSFFFFMSVTIFSACFDDLSALRTFHLTFMHSMRFLLYPPVRRSPSGK